MITQMLRAPVLVEIVLTKMSDSSSICICDDSPLFPRCMKTADFCEKKEAGYSTGKWSDDDDMGITPFFGPNR